MPLLTAQSPPGTSHVSVMTTSPLAQPRDYNRFAIPGFGLRAPPPPSTQCSHPLPRNLHRGVGDHALVPDIQRIP